MSIGSYMLRMAVVAAVAVGAAATVAAAQEDVCAAQDKRQACSMQCCGRRSCPPTCEVDCVKACVDACNSPAQQRSFGGQVRQLQLRCGNKAVH
jgi:hypothetical protein